MQNVISTNRIASLLARWAQLAFDHYLLQPMDGPQVQRNTKAAIAFCQANPRWRLSVQTHKVVGIA